MLCALEVDLDEVRGHQPDQDPSICTLCPCSCQSGQMSQLRQQSKEVSKEGHIEVQQKIQQNKMADISYMTEVMGNGSNGLKSFQKSCI
jgi:hypothetical protein